MDKVVFVQAYTGDHLVALRVDVGERMVAVSAVEDPHFGQMGEQRALEFLHKLHLIYFNQGIRHRIGTRFFMGHERIDLIMVERGQAQEVLGRDLKVHEELTRPHPPTKLHLVH